MANFLKPPGIDPKGYDASTATQQIGVGHYATLGLWGGGPNGEALVVSARDALTVKVVEQARSGQNRIFRVTGLRVGNSSIDAKTKGGAVWATAQIVVGGASTTTKRIVVDLQTQRVTAFDGATAVLAFDCVSGDADHPTDVGTFRVLRKAHPYTSHTYHVRMDHALFFTSDGKALHQYHGAVPLSLVRTMRARVSDFFGSHGCVRLSEADAAALYAWAPVGTTVQVR